MSVADWLSRSPVDSSASNNVDLTMARAMATRCSCPPEVASASDVHALRVQPALTRLSRDHDAV